MEKFMYVVFDKVSKTYGAPVCFESDPIALRWFHHVTAQNQYADSTDFDLFKVGVFDSETGVISPLSPEFLSHGGE